MVDDDISKTDLNKDGQISVEEMIKYYLAQNEN